MTKRALGVAWYPEQWPRDVWEDDVARMAAAGLTWVRIGEFGWSRIEPQPDRMAWAWLDDAIDCLHRAGLKVVLGTPTAAPPRWMLTRHPEMLAHDAEGRPRGFGSRRHYCFSHEGYRRECARIVTALAERYGAHPAIHMWQTDNEYGCHGTTLSYSPAAARAFQEWLAARYKTVEALNAAWGNVFWAMEYAAFDEIGLPNLTVTEPNPAHAMDFRRFSSDQVVSFNRLQTDIIAKFSSAPIVHNYMGRITDFDHFAVGADLQVASWDSYPLGFLEDRVGAEPHWQHRFARQGDPDFQAFHHDLYRAVGNGRWWVMEQQPGPVNWAPYNPAPLPGMVRLWTWEAFAHGAEAVVYFRWRQAPFAQEQMHAGLLRPDRADAPAMAEAREVAAELPSAPHAETAAAPVALMFDYAADFAWCVQPHGAGLSYFGVVFEAYRALRRLGLSVDVIPADPARLADHRVIVVPGLIELNAALKAALASSPAEVIVGPRTASRDRNMHIPDPLPPNLPGLDTTVTAAESLRPDLDVALEAGGTFHGWFEHLSGSAAVVERTADGRPAMVAAGRLTYLAGLPRETVWQRILERACGRANVPTVRVTEGLRVREAGPDRFWFNYDTVEHTAHGRSLPPAGVLRENAATPLSLPQV